MGWVKKNSKGTPEHECRKPKPQKIGTGSIWQCDVCYQFWKITSSPSLVIERSVWFNKGREPYHVWKKISAEEMYPVPPTSSRASSSDTAER